MADGTISIDVELNEKAFRASLENMGTIVKTGADLMIKSVGDLSKSFGLLPGTISSAVNSAPNIINGVINKIAGAIPEITEKIAETIIKDTKLISRTGFDLFCSLTSSLPSAIKEITKASAQIAIAVLEKFNSFHNQFKSVGENMIYGVWAGISGMASWLANSVTGFFQGIIDGVTGFLGIKSPSQLFRDLVGKNIVLGIKAGIDNNMPGVIYDTKMQMARLAGAAAQSSRLNFGAADIIGRSNTSNIADIFEMQSMLNNRLENGNGNRNSGPAASEINVILEPTGDIRGFFDYIRMGVKRSGYLHGEA